MLCWSAGLRKFAALFMLLVLLAACDKTETAAAKLEPKTVANAQTIKAADQPNQTATAATKQTTPALAALQQNQAANQALNSSLDMQVLDIGERSFDGGSALAVVFSAPVDASKKLQDYFEVYRNGQLQAGAWQLSASAKVAYFDAIEPSSRYQVVVNAGVTAKSGKRLAKLVSAEVATRGIAPAVDFASKDVFLTLNAQTGLPISSINVAAVDVNFYRLGDLARAYRLVDSYEISSYDLENIESWAKHLHFASYKLDAPRNKQRNFNLPIQDIAELNKTGVYLAVMVAHGQYQPLRARLFSVTDIGLHAHVYGNKIKVYGNSLHTSQPINSIEFSILNHKGQQLAVATGDQNGSAEFLLGKQEFNDARLLIAQTADSITFLRLQHPALDLAEFKINQRPFRPFEFFIYGQRDLYRPGETAIFSGLLRNYDGRLGKNVPLKAEIKDAEGKVLKSFSWTGNAQGYFEVAYDIASNAATGNWSLEVTNIDGTLISHNFKVEEFMPERLKLEFATAAYQQGASISSKLNAMYLYGAPASNNRVSSDVYVRNSAHPIKALAEFYFGDSTQTINEQQALDDVRLDQNGNTVLQVANRWQAAKTPLSLIFSASVFESGGRAVTRRSQTHILPAAKLIGIRPKFADDNPAANSKAQFELVYADENGQKFAKSAVQIRLVREQRDYYWSYNNQEGWHYEFSQAEYIEQINNVDIAADNTALIELPVEYGGYRIEAIADGLKTSMRFYAGTNWYADWSRNQRAGQSARPDKVSLAFDKGAYQAGDTALLSIVPPAAGESLVMVEADDLLWFKRVSVPKAGKNVEIPLQKSWDRHDIYVSVIHLQPTQRADNITAKRAIGIIHLPLLRDSRKLSIKIDAPAKVLPNQTQKVNINVQGAKGSAYVTLAAVDAGVLNITRFKTPDPFKFFFEPRRYQVDMRDMYQQIFALNNNALAKLRYGGDMLQDNALAAFSTGGKNAQAEVKIVSLFSGVVATDANGNAEVALKIPDFNGQVRLMALAFSDNEFGSAQQDMLIAAPVVTQMAMPRFLAMGDKSTFALDINNLTDETQDLDIKLTADNVVNVAKAYRHKQLKLAPKSKQTLLYPVSAAFVTGQSKVQLNISGVRDYPIKREWHLNTRAAYPALSEQFSTWLQPNAAHNFKVGNLSKLIPSSLEAVLSLNSHADLDLPRHLDYLLTYPYGCAEQSVSSTYPWLYASDANLKTLGLQNHNNAKRAASIAHGLQRIAQKQLTTGGYGMWSATSPEERWLTAYVAEFLYQARAAGISVDTRQYQSTLERLQYYLRTPEFSASRYSDDSLHSNFADSAYAAYVLSLHNKVTLSTLRSLAKQSGYARTPLALSHLALAFKLQGDELSATDLLAKAAQLTRPADIYLADYGSQLRDAAELLVLYMRHDLYKDKLQTLASELAEMLKDKVYLSTQERNSVFTAGLLLEQKYGKPWLVAAGFADKLQNIDAKGAYAKYYAGAELAQGLQVENIGSNAVLASVKLQGYAKTAPQLADSKYFSVRREYFNPQTGKAIALDNLQVGDLVLVFLDVVVKDKVIPDMLVVELLPAGLELENPNLDSAFKIADINMKIYGKDLAYWQNQGAIIHQEYRDDRFVAAINAESNMRYPLFYLARAVTPGTYQVPMTLVEDMYSPARRALGNSHAPLTIANP